MRVVPSAGALYPLDLYVAALRVEGLRAGLYYYDAYGQRLADLCVENPGARLRAALVDPDLHGTWAAVFLFAGVFWRSRVKYGNRSYRFVLLEAGHAAQNLLLVAEASNLAAFPWGGFYDHHLDALVGLDSVYESVIYSVVVGSRPGG